MANNHLNGTEPLVAGTGIGVCHGNQTILHDVDISVHRSEIVTLIGPNGSGKTTLVRSLLGLQKPKFGSVSSPKHVRIGYSPQSLAIDRTLPLSVRRFLEMAGIRSTEKLCEILDKVGAPNLLDHEMRLLSGGEQKRVMLARALLREPDLLVLDEPTANIDVHGRTGFYELIAAIRDERECGILLVSHDLHLVMSSTDRVICLNGHVCCSGKPDIVSQDPAYLELFGEVTPAVTLYTHQHNHNHA